MSDTPTTPPTEADLAELERLLAAGTATPWFNDLDAEDGRPEGLIMESHGYCICCVAHHGNINTVSRTGEQFSHDDARLIPEAVNALPALIAELRRLRGVEAERDNLRRLLGLAFHDWANLTNDQQQEIEAALEGKS